MGFLRMIKLLSAFLPIIMSFAALATIAVFVILHGTAPQADQYTIAHIWQLLMVCQVPIIAFFVLRWVPQSPMQGVPILVMQIGSTLVAMAPLLFSMVRPMVETRVNARRTSPPPNVSLKATALPVYSAGEGLICHQMSRRVGGKSWPW
jgi:hypothetical protein